jgi:hypothetical protein
MNKIITFILLAFGLLFLSCNDDEAFSTSTADKLTFSGDIISLDTVFSTVPSSTKSLWVYNRNNEGIRCNSIRLESGNQTGFRVNVNGLYLNSTNGYRANDVMLYHGDSLRVFVEVTAPVNGETMPKKISDNLIFELESGVEQKVKLQAWSWDATKISSLYVNNDTTIDGSSKPILISGGITVAKGAVLNIAAGTTLYFDSAAGIDVYGRVDIVGNVDKNVVLRGSRLDRMFDYLPYDRMSGQWSGIHFYESSYNNSIKYCDIHSAFNGIVCDSSDVEKIKLNLEESTIHNCQGYGLKSVNSNVVALNSQITNTLKNCIYIDGGNAAINACTIAQFYPFDSQRGTALYFSSVHPLNSLAVDNSIITGYADDQLAVLKKEGNDFKYIFRSCIIRTPEVTTSDSVYFNKVIFEDLKNKESMGKYNFIDIDADKQYYDFHLSDKSAAIDKADKTTAPISDRNGKKRNGVPDIGAYEY